MKRALIQDKLSKTPRPLEEGFADEEELQSFLRDHTSLIPMEDIDPGTPPLLCIGFEVRTTEGYQDLLYVDEDASLTIIEAKLKRNTQSRREVVGQILEYAAAACRWDAQDFEARAGRFLTSEECPKEFRGLSLEQAILHFLDDCGADIEAFSYSAFIKKLVRNLEAGRVRLIIAVDEIRPSLLETVEFVNEHSEHFEIFLLQLRRLHDKVSGANVFVPEIFGRVGASKRRRWDWEEYRRQPDWSSADIHGAQALLDRLLACVTETDPEARFHPTWISIHCFGKEAMGVGVSKKRGLHAWFKSDPKNPVKPPRRCSYDQTPSYLYLMGKVSGLSDMTLRRLCKDSLKQLGLNDA